MQDIPPLEHKFASFGKDLALTGAAAISGYASLFGRPDRGGDVVQPGAYAASLAALAAEGRSVKMLWQHDPAQPIGVWDEVREDSRGLFVKGRILTATAKGAEVAALIQAGAIDGLSIGYRTQKAVRGADGCRQLCQVELWEVSLVTFPMLPAARVSGKSSADTPGGEAAEPGSDALRALADGLRQITRDLKTGQST
ncbi:HK97 family phage prohead protease [Nocardioides marinus]|nr:HK97 family phage prohead protease [Nocardioides marinus]